MDRNHLTIETIFIGLNPVDIDSDSMNHPQISHTQRLISGIFIAGKSIIHCHLFQKRSNYSVWRYEPDDFNSEL